MDHDVSEAAKVVSEVVWQVGCVWGVLSCGRSAGGGEVSRYHSIS